MKKLLYSFASIIGGIALVIFIAHAQLVTAANPGANALFEQSLSQPDSNPQTDTNLYVTSGDDVQGNLLPVNSYQCFSVDTGQPNFEAICGTVTSSATTSLVMSISLRGLSTQTATTSNASQIFTHRRGADVRITDFPVLTIVNNQLNGTQILGGGPIHYPIGTIIGGSDFLALSDVAYVNSVVAAGCATASETVNGCSQLATQIQAASTTSTGSTGSRLVIPASMSTSTPGSAGLWNVISLNDGKLSPNWLNGSTENYTLNGQTNLASTTSYVFNTGSLEASSSASLPANTTVGGGSVFKFGGSGSDGVLSISSGVTTIDLQQKQIFTKNYSSISITGTGELAFTNPNPNGTLIILKSKGSATITCSSAPCIDDSGMGGQPNNGGYIFLGDFASTTSNGIGGNRGCSPTCTDLGGGGGGGISATTTTLLDRLNVRDIDLIAGSGGGQAGIGTPGGAGGGALYIEVGGSWNFTTANGISVSGKNGTSGGGSTSGGGGGGGGTFLAIYNSLTANSGTISISGGTGGAGDNGTTAGGAGGTVSSGGTGKGGTGGASTNTGGGGEGGGGGGGGSYFATQNGSNGGNNGSNTAASGGGGSAGLATTTMNYFFQ